MSNISEDNPIELERKFLISQDTAKQLIANSEAAGQITKEKRIEQNYLFKENGKVLYDVDNNMWNVTLKVGQKSKTFQFEEKQHPEVAKEVLSQYSGTDLLDTKCATRIRIMNAEPIFTFKRPIDGGDGDNEFEGNIQEYVEGCHLFLDFIINDPYKVNKDRFVINRDGFDYEIDFFDDIDLSKQNKDLDISSLESNELCLLEVEFNTQESHDNFILDVVNIEVTKTKGFGNKVMAKQLGKKSTKNKSKRNLSN